MGPADFKQGWIQLRSGGEPVPGAAPCKPWVYRGACVCTGQLNKCTQVTWFGLW